MKKTKKSKVYDASQIKNPVAKFAFRFNKAMVFKDKTKYQRNAKHKGQEPFPMIYSLLLEKVSAFIWSDCHCSDLSYQCNEYSD